MQFGFETVTTTELFARTVFHSARKRLNIATSRNEYATECVNGKLARMAHREVSGDQAPQLQHAMLTFVF